MIRIAAATLSFIAATSAYADDAPKLDYRALVADYYAQYQQPGFTIDDLLAFYAPDVDFRDPTFDITIRGAQEFRNLYSALGTDQTGYKNIKWTLDDIVVDGERVVIAGRWSGAYQDCPFDIEFMTLWRMKEGRIAYQRDFFAAGAFDEQVVWKDGKANCAAAAK